MLSEHWEELEAQVESHGSESVVLILETDSGSGEVTITDVIYEDDRVVVRLA